NHELLVAVALCLKSVSRQGVCHDGDTHLDHDDDLHDGCGDRLYEPQPAHNRRHCRAAEFEYSDFLGLGQLDRAAALTGISRCGHDRSGSTRRSYDVGLRMFRRPQLLHCPNQGGSVAKKAASTTKSVPTVLPPYLANEKQ